MKTKAHTRTYHFIYKTTCTITGKWYLGMHSTDDLNDGYLGSGKHLKRSVEKYGKDSHIREILEFLPCRDSLSAREEQLITEDMRRDPRCMNIANGGRHLRQNIPHTEETRQRMSETHKALGIPHRQKILEKMQTAEYKNKMAESTSKSSSLYWAKVRSGEITRTKKPKVNNNPE